jgi:hypothetical protein
MSTGRPPDEIRVIGKLTVPPGALVPDPSDSETLCPNVKACRTSRPRKARSYFRTTCTFLEPHKVHRRDDELALVEL